MRGRVDLLGYQPHPHDASPLELFDFEPRIGARRGLTQHAVELPTHPVDDVGGTEPARMQPQARAFTAVLIEQFDP